MKSPLSVYKEVSKEFGVTDDKNVAQVGKLSFAREQAEQMKHIVNRLVYDIVTTRIHIEDAKDDTTKHALKSKCSQYENDLRQTVGALDVANKLVKELESEVQG